MELKREKFGQLESGAEVFKYLLINDQIQVNVLNYGGIITEIYAPDKNGKRENVVLGFDNLKDYQEKSPYFGSITGRHAGRIAEAEFDLADKRYQLASNDGQHNLHGGLLGLDKRLWEVQELEQGIELYYCSPHLEEGFPANVEFKVSYQLFGNELVIEYQAQPDQKTLINLTNHSYFNLSGNCKRDILGHELLIKAKKFLALDEESIPTGEIREVADTAMDFTSFKKVGEEIDADYSQLKFTGGYDHPFILEESKDKVAILKEKESGRALSITTDQPVIVFYAGNQLKDEGELSCGVEARKRLALCLEAQDYPNAINIDNFPNQIYDAENSYTAKTSYKFYIE